MVGCSAKYCRSATYKGFRLFRFPVDKKRRQLWAEVCQRENWTPTDSSRLCNLHFTEDQFEQCRVDGWRRLKLNAIPTIFGGLTKRVTKKSKTLSRFYNVDILPEHNYAYRGIICNCTAPTLTEVCLKKETEIYENNSEMKLEVDDTTDSSTLTVKCAVTSCLNNATECNSDVTYHQFPNDKKLRKQWIKACGGIETLNFANSFICSSHFSEESFEKGLEDLEDLFTIRKNKWKLKVDAIPTLHLKASEEDFDQNCSIKQENDDNVEVFEMGHFVDFKDQLSSHDSNDYNTLKEQYGKLMNSYVALQMLCRKQKQIIEQLENEICEVRKQTNVL